jgi:hypothetical protein
MILIILITYTRELENDIYTRIRRNYYTTELYMNKSEPIVSDIKIFR